MDGNNLFGILLQKLLTVKSKNMNLFKPLKTMLPLLYYRGKSGTNVERSD